MPNANSDNDNDKKPKPETPDMPGAAVMIGDADPPEDLLTIRGTRPSEPPRASMLRLCDPEGRELAAINLQTGQVHLAEPVLVDEAAELFWNAIVAAWKHGLSKPVFRDFCFLGGAKSEQTRGGDVVFRAGASWGPSRGGDVIVTDVSRTELEE